MDQEMAHRLFTVIMASRETGLRDDLLALAVRYAHIRSEWWLARRRDEPTDENLRGRCHNALIDACNILSRAMGRAGEDTSWRLELAEDRKVIGDFACHVHCFLGLMAR